MSSQNRRRRSRLLKGSIWNLPNKNNRLTIDLLLFVILVFNGCKENGSFVGEQQTIRSKVLVTGKQDSVEHGLVEQEVTHPLQNQRQVSPSHVSSSASVKFTSEMIMSTCLTGSSTSSSLPFKRTISAKQVIQHLGRVCPYPKIDGDTYGHQRSH